MNRKPVTQRSDVSRQRRMAFGIAALIVLVVLGIGLIILGVNALSAWMGGSSSSVSPTPFVPQVTFVKPEAVATLAPPAGAAGTAAQPPVATANVVAQPPPANPEGALPGLIDFVCPQPHKAPDAFGYGIQSNWSVGDIGYWNSIMAEQMKLNWTKAQVRWSEYEPQQGKIDAGKFQLLDVFVADANKKGLNIVIGVIQAPAWTRKQNEPGLLGPPDDTKEAARFFGKLSARYAGCIQAIEIWNEMNLDREWRTPSGQIKATEYIDFLKAVVPAIKKQSPDMVAVMGALSPTGSSTDGKFKDDFVYMDEFVAAGGSALVDCVGVHLNGFNLPPDKEWNSGFNDRTAKFRGPFDNPNHSWSFISTLNGYRQKTQRPLCVTEFGWASMENLKRKDGTPVQGAPDGFGFALDNTEKEQADWIIQAWDIMRKSGFVRFGVVFNLDYIQKIGEEPDDPKANVSPYSIVRRDGSPRPAFEAIKALKKD